jgi:heptaprenyl diphosphate synthase
MLSRVSIRQDLKIPGGFGELIGESFRLFAVIMDSRQRITRKNLMGDIDALMIEMSEETPANPGTLPVEAAGGTTAESPAPKQRTTAAGFIILAVVVFLAWLPLIFMFML